MEEYGRFVGGGAARVATDKFLARRLAAATATENPTRLLSSIKRNLSSHFHLSKTIFYVTARELMRAFL
ncbi:MAG TPA: hypothetical protein VK400_08625 [Pyrinomonadaceae bacterium]|nr:hypothetical protein [Pyrinomonadaceae bacterium]